MDIELISFLLANGLGVVCFGLVKYTADEFDRWYDDAIPTKLRFLSVLGVPTTYGLIAVAFANATTTAGAVDFSIDSTLASKLGGYTQANFVSDVNTLHGQGRKVIISVGGQNGSISVSDSTSATNFANSVETLMTNWGFDGVDIDLENGINPTYMAQALQQIASSKSGVIISLAPQTIDMQSTSAG